VAATLSTRHSRQSKDGVSDRSVFSSGMYFPYWDEWMTSPQTFRIVGNFMFVLANRLYRTNRVVINIFIKKMKKNRVYLEGGGTELVLGNDILNYLRNVDKLDNSFEDHNI